MHEVELIKPGSFAPEDHYYPRVQNAQLHPLVRFFMSLSNERLAKRYCHLHPEADPDAVNELLNTSPQFFKWAGADLFHATTEHGVRRNVIIETNSSPSGQKSMPYEDGREFGGYQKIIERSFLPLLKRRLPQGALAVVADKNPMETRGYAATIAELTGEDVWWVHCTADNNRVRFTDGVMEIRNDDGWVPIRAAFRYVTQQPWNRIPPLAKTKFLNPVLVCLCGGRNKLMAAKAYDFFNAWAQDAGLELKTPETIWDVGKHEVPLWVERMGGVAVVKVPYANAGQGVYTITSPRELDAFMETEEAYDLFIVQGLIGNRNWSSRTQGSRLYQVGTVPSKNNNIYVADIRFMVGAAPDGFYPVAIYSRRAREPLAENLEPGQDSWGMLGTNLSVKHEDGSFTTEPQRLLLMDNRDFNKLGLGLDDLTEAYLQTVMSVRAIDDMAKRLVNSKGAFRRRLFFELNPDDVLSEEVI